MMEHPEPKDTKPTTLGTNPKDAAGVRKWRQFFAIPYRVMWEIGVAMLEGAMKYGRFNYRVTGVQASIYIDAARGHIDSWCEGQDIDPDSKLNHITKAITSLIVLRDGMIEGNFIDDRAPKHESFDAHTAELQGIVDGMMDKYPEPVKPFTQADRKTAPLRFLDMDTRQEPIGVGLAQNLGPMAETQADRKTAPLSFLDLATAEDLAAGPAVVKTSDMVIGQAYLAVRDHRGVDIKDGGVDIKDGGRWRCIRKEAGRVYGVKDHYSSAHQGVMLVDSYWWQRITTTDTIDLTPKSRPRPMNFIEDEV